MPENLASRDGFGSPVSRQPAHLHTQAEYGAYLRDSSPVPRRHPFIYLIRHTTLSVKSRVYRIMPLRTECVHCREFAVTGPVNLKVSSKRVLPGQVTMDQLTCASLSHTHYWRGSGGMMKVPGPSLNRSSFFNMHGSRQPHVFFSFSSFFCFPFF